jgi:hypothetical protein
MGKRREQARQRELENRLEQLGKLHDEGVLTDEEFTKQKAQLLDG